MNAPFHPSGKVAMCDGKVALTAKRALEIIKRDGFSKSRDKKRSAYRCPVCRAWHVGQAPVTGKGRT